MPSNTCAVSNIFTVKKKNGRILDSIDVPRKKEKDAFSRIPKAAGETILLMQKERGLH